MTDLEKHIQAEILLANIRAILGISNTVEQKVKRIISLVEAHCETKKES